MQKLRRRLQVAGVFVAAALGAGFYTTFRTTRQAEAMNGWVAHTQAVLAVISRVRLERSQLVNELWAYRSTRDARFSFRFALGMGFINQDVKELQRLTTDNPDQQVLLLQIGRLLTQQIAQLEDALASQDSVQAAAADSEGLVVASAFLEHSLDRLELNERQLLANRSAAEQSSSGFMRIEVLVAALLTQMVMGISAHLVQRHLVMRAELEGGLRRAREMLGLKYQEQGVELDKAIENLQAEIQARRDAECEVLKLNEELEMRVEQRTRELEDMNRELEAFSYSVSHDLRAPLRHMTGFAAILEQEYGASLPREAQHYIQRVRNAASHMSTLVEGLLQLSRIGRQAPRLQPCSLNSIVVEQRSALQSDVGNRQIEWQVEELPEIQGDRTLLEQVFANLLSNALKFTRGRSPAVIEIGSRESQGMALIFVRDNGAGFDPQHSTKLFGVFQRLHRQDEFEGTGIGLATVQRIIQKHGGRIWAEAQPDNGAAFYFTLPKAQSNSAEPKLTAGMLA